MRSTALLAVLLLLTLLGCPFYAWTQQRRPKIGLVLSGGGAKGMAHIGVLKVLERAGITPDYITGTSMGSLVGGLYAMGYSADQLEKLVENIDWDEVLTNKIPLNEVAIEEKPYYGRYAIELPVTKFFKVAFPGGIIEGEKLQQMFLDLTRPVHDLEDFNKLPIPFACVATDIATGQPVLLNKGSLAQCMRASMAIPTVFTPVEIDGKLLVDGGLVRNFPVQEAKDMGADIIIGVFVSDDLKTKDELNGIVDILFQTSWVLSAYDTRKQRESVDIYLQPDHAGYGTGDFKMAKYIIEQGEIEAEKFYPRFRRLADSIYAIAPRKQLVIPKAAEEYRIGSITVMGNEKIPASLIKAKLALNTNTVVSPKTIDKQVSLLFGTRHYSTVGYRLRRVDSTSYDLQLDVKESPPGKIKGAFHYDTENKAGVNVNLTLRNWLLPDSRVLMEVDLAEYPRATFSYLKYVGAKQDVAAMLNTDYNSFQSPIRTSDGTYALFGIDQYSLTGSIFSTSFTNHTFGASLGAMYLQLRPKISQGVLEHIDYVRNKTAVVQVFYQLNSLERPFYPRKGSRATVAFNEFFNTSTNLKFKPDSVASPGEQTSNSVARLDLDYMRIFPVRRSLSIIADARSSLSSDIDATGLNIIGTSFFGGFRPRTRDSYSFYGAHNFDYEANTFVMAKADAQFELSDHVYLTAGCNYINIAYPMKWFKQQYEPSGDLLDQRTWRLGYGVSIGYLSIVGPISFTLAMDSQRQQVLANFNLGFYY